jgi:hypothetical protein
MIRGARSDASLLRWQNEICIPPGGWRGDDVCGPAANVRARVMCFGWLELAWDRQHAIDTGD